MKGAKQASVALMLALCAQPALADARVSLGNFRGLRNYKDKFHPVWTPRYLASAGGAALPIALFDVTALIAGGVRAIVSKRA